MFRRLTDNGQAPMPHRKTIVVSAVNLVEGGTLAVLVRFLQSARTVLPDEWQIIALVHRTSLIAIPGVQAIAYPDVKASWLRRLLFEYWQCNALSEALRADVWVALHDLTPRVKSRRQAVYCHNPAPFFPLTWREALQEPKLLAFRWLYGLVYRINMHRNHSVVVQQQWLRDEFQRRYSARNVVVAHPVEQASDTPRSSRCLRGRIFIYPALARPFKNFELVCRAARLLEARPGWHGEIRLTLNGQENRYARALVAEYGDCRSVRFIGLQSRSAMSTQYAEANCLLFPSRKETWGLPLTEAKSRGLSILASDLPYAHESIGNYDGAAFFDVDNAEDLASKMLAFQNGTLAFSAHHPPAPASPFAANWDDLVRHLTEGV